MISESKAQSFQIGNRVFVFSAGNVLRNVQFMRLKSIVKIKLGKSIAMFV